MGQALQTDDSFTGFKTVANMLVYNQQSVQPWLRTVTSRQERIVKIDTQLKGNVVIEWTHDHRTFPENLLSLIEELRVLEDLKPNWDSYGAAALDVRVERPAVELMLIGHRTKSRLPRLVPLPDGGLSLIWQTDDTELDVAIDPDGCKFDVTEENLSTGEFSGPENMVSFKETKRLVTAYCSQ
jgi:hypothetical protein